MSSPVPHLSAAQLRAALDVRDLSDPAAGPHAIQILTDRAAAALAGAWSCEVRWCRGPKIVPVADNYDRLGYAPGAITREARYTRYVSGRRMLRSHSTAMVPPAVAEVSGDHVGDVRLPGDQAVENPLQVVPAIPWRESRPARKRPPRLGDGAVHVGE